MDIIVPKKKSRVILDATVLSTLMGCARLVDLSINRRFVPIKGKSNSLEVGSLVHKYLEVYYKTIIKRFTKEQAHQHGMAAAEMYVKGCQHCTDFVPSHVEEHTTSDGKHICRIDSIETGCILKPKCGHPIDEFPGLSNTPPEPNDSKDTRVGWKWALDTCEQYYEYYKNDFWVPLEVEVVKGEILYEDDDLIILWKSKLDLVSDTNQGIFPLDHKTGKARREKMRLNNQFIGQCLIQKTRTIFINNIGFQTSLEPKEKFYREPISYSTDLLMEWQSEILPYWGYRYLEYHESGYWPPNFTQCDTKYGPCRMRGICEANRDMREEELKINFKIGKEWNPTNEPD